MLQKYPSTGNRLNRLWCMLGFFSCVFVTLWTVALQAPLSFTISQSLLKFMVMLSNHLILCCPLLLLPSSILSMRVFSNELALHIRWPKYWRFSFSISPCKEVQGCFPLGLTSLISLLSKELLSKSFPAPQFEGINSLTLSLFYCPGLTSMHDYWKNHSFN